MEYKTTACGRPSSTCCRSLSLLMMGVRHLSFSFLHCSSMGRAQIIYAVFWHDNRVKPLIAPLISQIAFPLVSKQTSARGALGDALNGLMDCIEDDLLVKDMNLKVLMHTRSDDVRVRLAAVHCATDLWTVQGTRLRGEWSYLVGSVCRAHRWSSTLQDSHQRQQRSSSNVPRTRTMRSFVRVNGCATLWRM